MKTEARMEYVKYISETDDAEALLGELMTAYGREVWNYAYCIVRSRDMADDITQDVFLKVYRHIRSFRRDSSVKTWLLTITRNTAFDYRRSAFIRKVTLTDWLEDRKDDRSPEREVLEREALDEIWRMVLKLPVKYREALILFAHHQLSMKEIAEMLGVTEGTVKSRLFHARQKLAKMRGGSGHG